MDLRPVDLPRLRDDLIAFAHTDTAVELRALDVQDDRLPQGNATAIEIAAQHHLGAEIAALRQAALFYITPEMVDLATTAAQSLPEFTYEPDDVPTRQGLMYFTKTVNDVDADGRTIPVAAAGWYMTTAGVLVMTYIDRDAYPVRWHSDRARYRFPPIAPIGSCAIGFGDTNWLGMDPARDSGSALLATVKSVWLLMRQPLAENTPAVYDRASRRRFQREGKEPPPVRVIALRRPVGSHGTGEGGREWHHRWIVRGHWRQAAVGVGRQQRRPVWISPHVKGPVDAPLLGGEKVYVVKGDPT